MYKTTRQCKSLFFVFHLDSTEDKMRIIDTILQIMNEIKSKGSNFKGSKTVVISIISFDDDDDEALFEGFKVLDLFVSKLGNKYQIIPLFLLAKHS